MSLERLRSSFAKRKVFFFVLFGGISAAIGLALLYLLVDIVGTEKNIAYFLVTVLTVQINFILNARVTWGTSRKDFLVHWKKFNKAKVVTMGSNQVIFFVLTTSGFHHEIAAFFCGIFIMFVNYVVNNEYVFVANKVSEV